MLANLATGRVSQGGSTLTQQLAKNLFLEPERTVERKVQEAVLALWLETQFDKDEILELYLNRVYFGAGAWGVDAAAQAYFGKSARDLSLGESAMLAGLVKAPTRLNPKQDPVAAAARARLVLDAMEREGMITIAQSANALATSRAEALALRRGGRHYAADMVLAELARLVPDAKSDLIVETSIRDEFQSGAERSVTSELDTAAAKLAISQAALIALDGDGAVLAVIGGRDYARSQFNRAVDARRQPGSAFKPFVFLTALEAGGAPEDFRQDAPVRIGNWRPENYDREYRGPVTLTDALSQSINTVAARLVGEHGADNVARTARRLGMSSPLRENASIALGTSEVSLVELAAAYGAFANGGNLVTPYSIRRVMTAQGKVLYERAAKKPPQVVGAREVAMMNRMLAETIATGTGRAARIKGWQVAGKTGTTQNFRDAWFVGYAANLVTGVWVGNDDGAPMNKVTGGGTPARIWAQFMRQAIGELSPQPLPGIGMPEVAALPIARPQRAPGVEIEGGDAVPLPETDVGGRQPPREPGFLRLLFGG
jgi:penicillin-binding protein 1A